MGGVIPDWMREEARVRALLGDQANLTPEAQAGYGNYAPTGAQEPMIDPNTGDFIDTYGYFNQNNVQDITRLSNAMQEALQRGDNAGYEQALNAYRQTTGGLQPVWSYNITPQGVAANAPHPNDPWNEAWDRAQQQQSSGGTVSQLPTDPSTPNGRVDSSKGPGGQRRPLPGSGYTQPTETEIATGGRTPGGRQTPPGGERPGTITPPPYENIVTPPITSPRTPGGGGPPTGGGQIPVRPGVTDPAGSPGGGALPQYYSSPGGGGNPSAITVGAPPSSGPGWAGGPGNTQPTAGLPGYSSPYQAPAFNPNQGLDPLYYGYQIGAAGNPSLSYIPDLTTNDPNRIMRNVQNIAYNYGAGNAAQLGNELAEQSRLYTGYGNAANEAFSRLNETPGYTQDEAGNIIREGDYRGAMTTPGEYASLAPTSAEEAGMRGNVASYADYFDPQRFNDINQGNKNMQYANLDRVSGAQDSALGGLSHAYDTAIDPNRLRIDPEYRRQAGMTDAEVERMTNAGARNVGLSTQAAIQDMERRAAASGRTSPLAMGALRNRMMQTGQVNAADARVNAELAAREAQRRAATGVEQTRLGAEQGLTGYQTAAARDLANQQIAAAQFQGQLTKAAQDQIAANELNSQQYITGTGINLRKDQDAARAAREAALYGIRQGNTQYAQQSKYNQGMGVNQALSNNYAAVAQARMAGQDKYRGYLTGQQQQALGAKQTAQGQNLQNYNAMTGALNSNASMWGNYSLGKQSLPAGWQQIIAGIVSGGGAATQQPSTF